jgi:hypothetical protein
MEADRNLMWAFYDKIKALVWFAFVERQIRKQEMFDKLDERYFNVES